MKRAPLIVLSLCFASLAFAQDLSKPVIVVNGLGVTYQSYFRKMERLPGVGQRVGDEFVPGAPGFLTLQKIINDTLVKQLAVEKGVAPTDKDVDDEYAAAIVEDPEGVKALLGRGLTEEDLKDQFRIQISEFKLQTMGINIGDQQVEEYYTSNQTKYITPKRYQLYVIAVDTTDEQDAVDKELNANQPFTEVAKKLSKDVLAPMGGYMGLKSETILTDRIRSQVGSLNKGESTSWFEANGRKVKFWVGDILPAQKAELTPQLRKAIRQRLMLDRGRIKNDLETWMKDMRKRAKIDFQGTPFDQDLKNLFQGGS